MEYARGDAVVVAGTSALVMVDTADADRIRQLTDVVGRGAAPAEMIAVLTPDGDGARTFTDLPDFAVALREAAGVRILVRGRFAVQVRSAGEQVSVIDGARASTWREDVLEAATAVRLAETTQAPADFESPGATWALTAGVVWACWVGWSFEDAPITPRPAPPAPDPSLTQPPPAEPDEDEDGDEDAEDARTGRAAQQHDAQPAPTPAPTSGPPPSRLIPTVPASWLTRRPSTRRSPAPLLPVSTATPDNPTPGPDVQHRPTLQPGPTLQPVVRQPPAIRNWNNSLTVSRASAGQPSPEPSGPPEATPGGEELLAVRCAADHLSPAGQRTCRVCGQVIKDQEPFAVTRPRLGRLCLQGLPDLVVSGSVILGRAPTAVGDAAGLQLVRLDNPQKDISRSHAEIRVQGWEISVVDLGTENGTVVLYPTGERFQLQPHVPVTILPSSTVTLSDRLSFWFEVP
jgi:hypothetical protein